MGKVFVLGIDGAFPEFIFGDWLAELPNIGKLFEQGIYAKLNSTIPPLSITAWTSILTGKPPADTGIFEYVYRKNYSYSDVGIVTSRNLKEKTIWEIASERGKKSAVCFPILGWPIKPFNGNLLSGSLTPSGEDVESTHPKELKKEIDDFLGERLLFDVPGFRDFSKEETIEEVKKLTDKHIDAILYLLKNKEWDLFYGLIGLSDRMNHSFWKFMDVKHRGYDPNSKFKDTLKEYYKYVDKRLGEMIDVLDEDTKIIVLSDHGITRMHNRVNLTDWLIENGYMFLKEPVKEKCRFRPDMVDWKRTKVFAIGAYEGQLFFNLKGREPEGIVEAEDYDKLLDELIEKLGKIKGDDGSELDTKFFKKKDYFEGKCGDKAPDLLLYFDDLEYGCNTTLIGNETLWSPQTARGSDDAGHSKQGIFIMNDKKSGHKNMGEVSYLDVAPTILNLLNVEIPEDMKGKVIGV